MTRVPGHKIRWWAYAGAERVPVLKTHRGTWAFDASCSCGWDSGIGGGTRGAVKRAIADHKADAAFTAWLARPWEVGEEVEYKMTDSPRWFRGRVREIRPAGVTDTGIAFPERVEVEAGSFPYMVTEIGQFGDVRLRRVLPGGGALPRPEAEHAAGGHVHHTHPGCARCAEANQHHHDQRSPR